MTPRLTTNYAKNYCNRTLIVKVYCRKCSHMFFMGHSVGYVLLFTVVSALVSVSGKNHYSFDIFISRYFQLSPCHSGTARAHNTSPVLLLLHYDNWRLVTAEDITTFSFKIASDLSTLEQNSVHQSNLNASDVGLDFLVKPSSRMMTWAESVPGELGTSSHSEFTIYVIKAVAFHWLTLYLYCTLLNCTLFRALVVSKVYCCSTV